MSVKNNLNPWDSVPTQIPTALAPSQTMTTVPNPQQVAVAPSTHSNPSQIVTNSFINKWFQSVQQRNPAPTQIPTTLASSQTIPAIQNPQHVAVAPSTHSNPSQTVTAVSGTQQVPVVKKTKKIVVRSGYIEIEPDHKRGLDELDKPARKQLYADIGTGCFKHIIKHHNKTISKIDAIKINKVAGKKIFNISEEDVQKYSIPQAERLATAKGRKRQLENPAVLQSKKQRTNADNQPTTIDVNAPYPHRFPVYYVSQDPSQEIPASMPAQESNISPETTVVPEEFDSLVDSNATAETNQSESYSGSSSPLELLPDFNGFEVDEFNDNGNTIIDWSLWGTSISEDLSYQQL